MKKVIFIFAGFLTLISCEKTVIQEEKPIESHPQMFYKNFGDTAVLFGRGASFDLNDDGSKDIYFTTLLLGDPIAKQDKRQWYVQSSFFANLPVNDNENIPQLSAGDSIPVNNFSGYTWYNASNILLAQKVFYETQEPPSWEGNWKTAQHQFIPIQIIQNSKYYNGWIEISFSMSAEKAIIHRSGISKQENQTVQAGK
jgi:hypothetical protein